MSIAVINAGLAYHIRTIDEPPFDKYFGPRIGLRDLADTQLDDLPCLMIPCRTNGARLAPFRSKLADYMAQGGTLVVMGETHPQLYIDDLDVTPEPTNFWWWLEKGSDLGVRISSPDHPLISGMRQEDVTWHIHGTLSFDAPSDTLVNWKNADDRPQPILSAQSRGRGRLIITTLDPIYHHGSGFMPATTAFLHGFLPRLCNLI